MADAINGFVPTINVTGSGTAISPWAWVIDEDWANEVAALPAAVAALANIAPDGIWEAANSTVDQGASTNIAHTGYDAFVWVAPYTVAYNFRIVLSAAGTAASGVSVDLPQPAAQAELVIGHGQIRDVSTSQIYVGLWVGYSTSTIRFYPGGSTYTEWGANPNLALASGDILIGSVIYESSAAS